MSFNEAITQILIALASFVAQPAPVPEPVPMTVPEPVCTEDMPCWDCETMGNGACGPTEGAVVYSHQAGFLVIGHYVEEFPGSFRVFYTDIDAPEGTYFDTSCDTFKMSGIGERVTLEALNSPVDGTCRIVSGY